MLLALLNSAILALVYTLDKELLKFLPPMLFLSLRALICGGFFSVVFFTFNKNYKIKLKEFAMLSLISILYVYLTNYFLYKAFQSLTSAKVTLIYNFNPFIVALLSFFIFRERFSIKKILGMIIGWLGFIPLLFFNNSGTQAIGVLSWGEIFALLSALSAACSFILLQRALLKKSIPIAYTGSVTFLVGGFFALFNSILTETPYSYKIYGNLSNSYVIWLFLVILLGTIAWAYINTYLSINYKASVLSFIGFTIPLFTAVMERLFFSRTVGYNFYISLSLITIGLYLFYKSK